MLKGLSCGNGQADDQSGGPTLKRDRRTLLIGSLLIGIAALAWVVVILQATSMQALQGVMTEKSGMEMTPAAHSPSASVMAVSAADAAAFLLSWGVMMTAMMLPSATPMIALYSTVYRSFSQTGQNGISTGLFTAVYLALWLAFGIPVYAANVLIHFAVSTNPAIASLLPYALALVLLAAGAYQFSPLKQVCLRVCQSPLGFLMGHWRTGYSGTLKMGLQHAAYCLGCCWGLMIVLVGAGAMALQWVLLIAVVVFAEKLLPRGEWTARIVGGVFLLLGLLIIVQPHLVTVLRGQTM